MFSYQLLPAFIDFVSQMVAITRAPGCFRWYNCCGKFRVNARKVRSIVEGDICQGVFGGVVNNGKSGLPIDSKTIERTHAQITECLKATNKGTSRRGVLQRYSAVGFVRYNVPNRGGLAAQNGFANVGIVEELGDDNYGDQDLARNVVPGDIFEGMCRAAAQGAAVELYFYACMTRKAKPYLSNYGHLQLRTNLIRF